MQPYRLSRHQRMANRFRRATVSDRISGPGHRRMLPYEDVEGRAEAALRAAGDIGYIWDLRSDRILWQGAVGRVLGIADESAIASGRSFAGRVNPEDLPQRQHRLSEAREGAPFACEYRLRDESGRFHWI